ncbi:MAG: DUF1343 domain-containing protein [Candidatus Hydrogenedentes bacterium]|nr:DUF1343 domain-containing protein [Candidatus Hydrogenedentota bacterium]
MNQQPIVYPSGPDADPAVWNALLGDTLRVSKSPGCVAYIGDLQKTYLHEASGFRQIAPASLPVQKDTPYDLASLTKVVATATALMLLHEAGQLELDRSVFHYLPIPAFEPITVRHCLTHSAGLVSGLPYYKESSTIDEMLQRYAALPLKWKPGTRWLYSDVGFMILGRIVEIAAADALDRFCANRIFTPLGMKDTRFKPDAAYAARCAATEKCPWRKKLVVGEVHDENAYAVGGVAGHAGLFSTADDLATFCRAYLSGKVLKPETLDTMMKVPQIPAWPWQGLGWQVDPWSTKNSGFLPSRTAFGHSGWTGTSLWMDRASGLFAMQLGNTCHPSRATRNNEDFRRIFYTGVAKAFYPRSTNTHSGLDRVLREDFQDLRGKKIALLTHHAAVDQLGRGILDVLALAPEVTISIVYSPEHGLRGQAEAGESVASEKAKYPIVSLYGDRKAPSKEELAGIDVFVVDLQDVGARYYTYAATMKSCMEVCAQARVPVLVLVLDRPNPVGGAVLEGPIAENTSSMVCWGAVPVRHGLTMGEIALHFQKTLFAKQRLSVSVSALDAWAPERLFPECSLPWLAPSPNIPTAHAALLYVGTCLFEGTNLNEGRGTGTPFEMFGAPWLNPKEVIAQVPAPVCAGCKLEAVEYTPVSIPGKASTPRYQDERCDGIRITVTDSAAIRPFALAVGLISAIRRTHPKEFEWGKTFDVLAGSADLRESIEKGEPVETLLARIQTPLAAYDAERPKLYAEAAKPPA